MLPSVVSHVLIAARQKAQLRRSLTWDFFPLTPIIQLPVLKRWIWPELFSMSPKCVFQVMVNKWERALLWQITFSHFRDTQNIMIKGTAKKVGRGLILLSSGNLSFYATKWISLWYILLFLPIHLPFNTFISILQFYNSSVQNRLLLTWISSIV